MNNRDAKSRVEMRITVAINYAVAISERIVIRQVF